MKAFLMTLFWVMGCSAFLFSQPVITVHFANPQYNCNTNAYCVDVEFQSNTANQEIFGMNVRFFYDDSALELIGFSGFVPNYSAVAPNPPNNSQSTLSYGQSYFTFQGAADYINGAFERTSTGTPLIVSTTGWTKIFSICFTVNNPYPSQQSFCPPIVWDLEEIPANGGFFSTSEGVVITLAAPGGNSNPATENVDQFNWTYGAPGIYGHPIIETCYNVDCTLPVELLSFTGYNNEKGNHLQWKTTEELNNFGFEVQKSLDGINWEVLGLVEAIESLQQTKQYNFTDFKPAFGKNLYRLKQLDMDGHFQFSPIVRIDAGKNRNEDGILVYPNPISEGSITINLTGAGLEVSTIQLFSSTGQLVRQYAKEGQIFQLDVNDLETGIYMLRITRGDEELYKKIMIN